MEGKFLKDPNNKCDYVFISADEQSFTYLNQGNPLRIGFFIDNNENLPWHRRKSMVVIIGKDLNFEKHKTYKEGFFKKGLVDKSYLVDYIQKMKKKLIQMAMQELEVLDLPGEPMDTKAMIEDMQESPEVVEEPKEYINLAKTSEMLKVSQCTLRNLAKRGIVKGENTGNGWYFVKSDMEDLLKEQPGFLTKIWNGRRTITKGERRNTKIIDGEDVYVHINRAKEILNLSEGTIVKYVKLGLIRHKKESGKNYYISVKHTEELKANPPDWLKKSWSYFNNNKTQ